MCSESLGYFSKKLLRKYFKNSSKMSSTGIRTIVCNSRKAKGDIRYKANEIVRSCIFPILRDCHITFPLRDDDLVITYANKMALKSSKSHHYPMIRWPLRSIGKISCEIKKVDQTVGDFSYRYWNHQNNCTVGFTKRLLQVSFNWKFCRHSIKQMCQYFYVTELIKQENHEFKAPILYF